MQTLQVDVGHSRYPIAIGSGLLSDRKWLQDQIPAGDLMVVSNPTVAALYLAKLAASLADRRIGECILPDGEQYKTLQTVATVLDALVERKLNRDAIVLALGGGVIGDIAGFSASCYQRGVRYVQIPTTLLAQVDSSVGGKTGVNHSGGKNLIGAFYQPVAVIADTDSLATLPDREFAAGLAEVIKYGCIWDPGLFAWLDLNMPALKARDSAALTHAIARSCEIKAAVVAKDEREKDLRAILNFGHTFGHAIEAATHYQTYLHGEAVAIGMVMAADLSRRLGLIEGADQERIRSILTRAGLPTAAPRIGAARVLELMSMDKKVLAGTVRLVLLEKLGKALVTGKYPAEALAATLEEVLQLSEFAPYAANEAHSRGRRFAEPKPAYRSEYQRDRDRIVHSTAFRRLVYKTQVFVNHEGDLYRTRLTHSLEVAQIARTIAHTLCLNEDLAEAICLAHDLGHTPFGHAGQDALNECMKDFGGFEHNLQSLRVVDVLEEHYADFDGLNLTFECREGILKHCSVKNALQLGDVGERFVQRQQPSLEAQLANFADEIAYNNHDVEDGIRAGLITEEQLLGVPLFGTYHAEVLARYPALCGRRLVYEILRRMINHLTTDLIDSSQARLQESGVRSIAEVRAQPGALIGFSPATREYNQALKEFLRESLYKHYRVRRMTSKAGRVMRELFDAFFNDPGLMPDEHKATGRRFEAQHGPAGLARAVADYIAGMTDRYAILEHSRLFEPRERT